MGYVVLPRTNKPTGELAERLRRVRYVISDADGTMFTSGKAVVDAAGKPSFELVETIVELARAGVGVIPCTGRNRAMTLEDARLLAFPGWIAEMGGLLCTKQCSNPEWSYYTGEMPYTPEQQAAGITPHDVVCNTGVIDEMLRRWPGKLEPYHDNGIGFDYREVTVALRGSIDEDEAQRMLDATGLPIYLADNGFVPRISGDTTLECDPVHPVGVHTYHITPRGVDKGTGIARYLELQGWDPAWVLGCGDSPADLTMAPVVGTFLLMHNGIDNPKTQDALASCENVLVSERDSTDGWCDSMRMVLAAKE